jgi:uncharacterized membrane protein
MKLTPTIGRILFALPLIGFGISHLTDASSMTGVVPSYIPGGIFWVYFSGIALIAAGIAIIINRYASQACWGLALFLLLIILTIQIPHLMSSNTQTQEMGMTNLFKDTIALGASIFMTGYLNNK